MRPAEPPLLFSGYLDPALGSQSLSAPLSAGAGLARVTGSKSRTLCGRPFTPRQLRLIPHQNLSQRTPQGERTENQRNNFGRWITRLARR